MKTCFWVEAMRNNQVSSLYGWTVDGCAYKLKRQKHSSLKENCYNKLIGISSKWANVISLYTFDT